MMILHIIPSYYPAVQFGGPTFSVHTLNKALVKQGIKVTVCTTNVGIEGQVRAGAPENVEGVTTWYFPYVKWLNVFNPTGYQYSPALRRWLKKNITRFDIVHITAVWNYPALVGTRAAQKAEKPYLLSPRGVLYPYTLRKKFWKKWPYFKLFVRRILEKAAAIHYTTEDEREQCHSFLGLKNKAVVVPNGLELNKFEELPSKKEFFRLYPQLRGKRIVLYLGRINWKKGLDILLEAFSELVKLKKNLHLVLAGEDDGDGYKRKMEKLADDLGVERFVTFTGILTGMEKLSALVAADIFVLPSYSENFGMAVIEAMACRCPVIISNRVGIYREVQQAEAGIVIEPAVSDIAKAIKLLIDNKDLRKLISDKGYKLVKSQYDIDKVAEKMVEVYENIIRGI